MNKHSEWKDNETGYCADLVRTGGDRNVPRESVASYLALQFHDAVRCNAVAAQHELARLVNIWADQFPESDLDLSELDQNR